ncbi:hypothetical protein EC968_007337 [Mortierella alpina]|nr:hypothetical protein EC968_007337 [Mortierella alpina]
MEALSLKDTPPSVEKRSGSHTVKSHQEFQGTTPTPPAPVPLPLPLPLPPSKPPRLPGTIAARTTPDPNTEQSTPAPSLPQRPALPARPTPPQRPSLPQRPELPHRPELPQRPEVPQRPELANRPELPQRPALPKRTVHTAVKEQHTSTVTTRTASSTNGSSSSSYVSHGSSSYASSSSSSSLSSSACCPPADEEDTLLAALARSQPVFTTEFTGERLDLTHIDFSIQDNHAIACPESETESIGRLSWYLTSPFPGDPVAQLRAIFFWMAKNIEYNMVGFQSGNLGDNSAEAVLRNRTGVCAGYANLFEALAAPQQLGVTQVYGMARGYGIEVGDGSLGGAHAWNAVTIQGERLLIDSTWGAGAVCPNAPDTPKQMNPHYFLVRPEHLIYSHWPTHAEQQFLDPPVHVEVYRALPFRTSTSWALGIAPAGRFTSQTVRAEDDYFEVEVSLAKRSWDKAFATIFVRLEWKTPTTTLTTTRTLRPAVHWTREEDEAVIMTIKGLCPGPGYGVLHVAGKSPDDKGYEGQGALSYRVVNDGSGANWQPLMQTYMAKGFSYSVVEPITAQVQSGVMQTIRVRIFGVEPGTARPRIVLIDHGNKPEPMQEVEPDVFETRKVLRPGQYKVGFMESGDPPGFKKAAPAAKTSGGGGMGSFMNAMLGSATAVTTSVFDAV